MEGAATGAGRVHEGEAYESWGWVATGARLDGWRVWAGGYAGAGPESEDVGVKHSAKFLAIVDDARSRVKECRVEDVRGMLEAGEAFVLVDVREESEFAKGRLPGAMHLGKGVIERDAEAKLPDPDARIVLYCGGGYRSALAADNLQKMGYTNVISMDGGYREWTQAGLPTEPPG